MAESRSHTEMQSIELNNFTLLFENLKRNVDMKMEDYRVHRARVGKGVTIEEQKRIVNQSDSPQENKEFLLGGLEKEKHQKRGKQTEQEKEERKNFIKKLYEVYGSSSFDILEKEDSYVSKDLFFLTLQNELKKINQNHLENPNKNSKEGLIEYLNKLEALFKRADVIYTERFKGKDDAHFYNSETKKLLDALNSFCTAHRPLFEKAQDIKIYKANIPESEFEKIYSDSDKFFYQGMGKAVKKMAIGSLSIVGTAIAVPVVVVGVVAAAFFGADVPIPEAGPGGSSKKTSSGKGKTPQDRLSSGFFSRLVDGISRYGQQTHASITAEYIQGTVNISEQNKELIPLEGEKNAGYAEPNGQEKRKTVYILDGNPCEEVFKNGVNPNQGQAVYFKNLKDAMLMLFTNTFNLNPNLEYTKDKGWDTEATTKPISERRLT